MAKPRDGVEIPAETALPAPTVTDLGDGYACSWYEGAVVITMRHVRENRDEPSAEVEVTTSLPPSPGTLEWGRLILTTISSRGTLAKQLEKRLPSFDWGAALMQAAYAAVSRMREGDETISLPAVKPRGAQRWLLYPYIEFGGPTVLFATGGSGKSVVALAMALSLTTGTPLVGTPRVPPTRCLYLDWETDAETHAERLQGLANANLFGAETPDIRYRRMVARLPDAVEVLRREVQRLGVGFIVVDSISWCGCGDLKDSVAAQTYYACIRQIGVPALGLAHEPKAYTNGSDVAGQSSAFGSVFWSNGARLVWKAEGHKEEGSSQLTIKLTQTKENNTVRAATHGYTLDWRVASDTDEVVGIKVARADLTQIAQFAKNLPWGQRIASVLREGKADRQAIAEQLEESPDRVSQELTRAKRRGLVMQFPDGRWGLAAR